MKKTRIIICILTLGMILIPMDISALERMQVTEGVENIKSIEAELETIGTDVVTELEDAKKDYIELLEKTVIIEEKEKIEALISSLDDMIKSYNGYENQNNRLILIRPYQNEVAAVIAYFNAQGYKLSSELLSHAWNNKSLNSSYTPVYGYYVQSSSTFRNISNGKTTSGSGAFLNSGTVRERDCYYAIHKFNYTKPTATSKIVDIKDRYDFAQGTYSGIAGIAVNTMYTAQQVGSLVPFYTTIRCSND